VGERQLDAGPVVLGLDFGGTKIAAAVSELDGTWIGTRVTQTSPELGAEANFARGIDCARQLLDTAGASRPLGAVGAATFGIPRAGGVELARAIPGWGELHLADDLRRVFDCPVSVSNDVKAATAAEARFGALAGCDPGIYINLGTGLAVGIVCGGSVVAGAHNAAGEIGYNLRHVGDLDPEAGPRVMLEDAVSGMALAAAGRRETGEEISAAEVFGAGSDGPDGGALAATLDEFVRELTFHVVNLAVALDPARVVVGGGMVRSWPRIEAPLRDALSTIAPFPPELVEAAFPYDAPLVGAVALAIEAMSDIETVKAGRPTGYSRRHESGTDARTKEVASR
jgi:glucokinase